MSLRLLRALFRRRRPAPDEWALVLEWRQAADDMEERRRCGHEPQLYPEAIYRACAHALADRLEGQ